jgi:DNA-binding NtrC family response regulator
MKKKKVPKILVVGSQAGFAELFDALEATGAYQMAYAAYWGTANVLLEPAPDVLLLHIPSEKRAREQALEWVEKLKGEVPFVVLSTAADMEGYVACMSRGAFDYMTSYTPVEEMRRVIERALHYKQPVAA